MANRLASSTSPYLLQHADNPVDWFEWGEAAFTEARNRDVPVLLSVGYSACHWCHVMAHESFEDPMTAEFMNEHFVNVKVDREERPDVDRIYMEAVQAMTGRGGWPMTVFMDGDGRPFFAGTYFPKDDRHGHPSFRRVLESIVHAWQHRRTDIAEQGKRLADAINVSIPAAETQPSLQLIEPALGKIIAGHDVEHGGFGGAPKFPQVPALEFLLRAVATGKAGRHEDDARSVVEHSLRHMAAGGIHDHLGGGFARYSVDRRWLVPHFEKMLYDNALLARLYLRAGQVTGSAEFTKTARSTLDYLIRDMTHPDGGLYAAEDADSEGVEGKFYVWSWNELGEILGEDRTWAAAIYGAAPAGNFEGNTILERFRSSSDIAAAMGTDLYAVAAAKERIDEALRPVRETRVRPGLDDKVLAAWNGLGLWAFAEAGAVLSEQRYVDHAEGIAGFVLGNLRRSDGRLMRSWRDGRLSVPGFCDDYAAMAVGLFSLYQATGKAHWFAEAERLTREMLERFWDADAGGFFASGHDAEQLIARPKEFMDNPSPSGNSLAAESLQILAALTGDTTLLERRDAVLRTAGMLVERHPSAVAHLLAVLVTGEAGIREVAIVGPDRDDLERTVWSSYRPDVVVAASPAATDTPPLLAGRSFEGSARAFVCRDFVCDLPVETAADLAEKLAR